MASNSPRATVSVTKSTIVALTMADVASSSPITKPQPRNTVGFGNAAMTGNPKMSTATPTMRMGRRPATSLRAPRIGVPTNCASA